MAELNFGLLTPPGSQSVGNAFVSGMDQAAAARAQENQNALSQYTLAKAKREDELTNQMLAGLKGATTIEEQAAVLRSVGKVKEANELITSGLDRKLKLGQIEAQAPALQLVQSNILDKSLDRFRGEAPRIQTPDAIPNYVRQMYADSVLGPYAVKLKPLDQAIEENVAEFTANPDRWRAMHTSVTGLQIMQATMPKPQVVGGNIANMNPLAGQVGAPITGAPTIPQGTTARSQADVAAAVARGAPPAEIAALTAAVNDPLVRQQQGRDRLAQGAAGLAIRNREADPYGMFPPITAGGAPTVNALPGQPRPTVNALPTQVSGAAPVAPVAAPAGTAPKMTVAEAFQNNVTGPEFVAVLPPMVKPLVESILRYDQRPPNPATKRGQQLLELVNQADKTYDAGKAQSRYVAKQTFVKGPVADSITASNTAIDHMDTLAKYGADLNNTDVRLVNAAKQGIAAAFGANAPTTFDATRRIVGQEVVKAVVANGGSMREREEAADAFNRANSPAQLAGVIQSYQALLGGRLKSTALRYENDTGLKDFNTKLLPATIRAISGETVAPAAATTTPKAAPAVGAIQEGYRFKGGDPAKVSNWEKVGG